jgi:hypothetical protein
LAAQSRHETLADLKIGLQKTRRKRWHNPSTTLRARSQRYEDGNEFGGLALGNTWEEGLVWDGVGDMIWMFLQ